jgi:hypothetical protein
MPVSTFGPEDLTYHVKAQAFNNVAILVGFRLVGIRLQASATRPFLKPVT